ncbi:MAG: tetratricopeptide repeat protein [Prolixibacteraceae bacterium]|nr:tetratricopeptide repeat protein [Prolixibacteraceae bacterium]
MANDQGFYEGIADAKIGIGKIYYNWGNFDKALANFIDAHKHTLQCNYYGGQSRALNHIGKYYHSVGEFKKSYEFFLDGLQIALNLRDSTVITELHRNIGNFYLTVGNTGKALESYYLALEYSSAENDPINFASVNNQLGNIYQAKGDTKKAMHYHCLALKIRTKQLYYEGIGKSLKNIGEVFEFQGQLDSALLYYQNARVIFEEINYLKGKVKCLNNMGRILGATDSIAYDYLIESLELSSQMNYAKGIINAEQTLSVFYIQNGKFEMGRQHLEHALTIAMANGANEMVEALLLNFYQLELELQNYQSALDYYVKYSQIKDENDQIANQLNFDELQVAYESASKGKQNELLRKDIELKGLAIRQRNIMIVMSGLLILTLLTMVIISLVNLKRKKCSNRVLHELNTIVVKKNEELNELNERLTRANNEKDKLYAIMVHELRNPLQWFRQLTGMLNKNYQSMDRQKLFKSLNALDESANHAYHLMDNLLHWTRSQLGRIQFEPERIVIEKIIKENTAFAQSALGYKEIQIKTDCPENLVVKFDKMMLNTILRNLITNAIKFTPEKGQIKILVEALKGEKVLVSVSDSGVGIKDSDQFKIFNSSEKFSTIGLMNEKGTGIGLLLCKEFIEQHGETIQFESKLGLGTVFRFTLPLY